MSKQSGLGDRLFVDGVDLSGDTGSLGAIGGGPSPLDVTGINQSAFHRIGGIRDGRIEWTSWFNPAASAAHASLKTLPTTNRIVTYLRGAALGSEGASLVGKQIGYDPTRNQDGSLSIALSVPATEFGLEWGRQLTAGIRTDSTATNGGGVDFGTGSTTFGLQAWLHVFAFTGTSATITIQQSSDDGSGDAYAAVTGGAFASVTTAPLSERIQTARNQTVERWLRVVTTGTFSNLQFAVVVARNDVSVVF